MSEKKEHIAPVRRRLVATAVAAACMLMPGALCAQGVAQVQLSGIPPVLRSPVVSELAVGFEQGRFPLSVVLTTADRQPVELMLRFLLERDGETVFDIESEPVGFTGGVHVYTSFDQDPPLTFPVSYRDLLAAAAGALGQDISRTGLLSEGVYTLTAEARSADPSRLLLTVPSISTFFVQYLEPVVLLSPGPEEVVRDQLPVFSWMPVLGGPAGVLFDYSFLLVEVYPGQEAQQAIESNRPIEIIDIAARTSLPYTQDRLPLEPGKKYAWQVKARDAEGQLPFTDGGLSEISTFVYDPSNPAMAAWAYPYSRPTVTFNLSDAALGSDGYFVNGFVEGSTGAAPVGAYFNNVLIDPVTLGVRDGTVYIPGNLAENAGSIESGSLLHIMSDETGPSLPPISVRQSTSDGGTRLDVVVGPSVDPESGIANVSVRLWSAGPPENAADRDRSLGGWRTVFSHIGPEVGSFEGASLRLNVPESAEDALSLGWLEIQARVTNGLGIESLTSERVGVPADVSPPVLDIDGLAYSGYYNRENPNAVRLLNLRALDGESGIASLQYRFQNEPNGSWRTIAEPGTDRFSSDDLEIRLPDVVGDSTFTIQIRAANRAQLFASWQGSVRVEIDETPPVQVGELGVFVSSDVDPRVELAAAAIGDPESGIIDIAYRVVDETRPTTVYVDWTAYPSSGTADVKRTQLNFAEGRNVKLEVRAENGAHLSRSFSQSLSIPALAIADQSPPTAPAITVQLTEASNLVAQTVLSIRIGESVDRQSGVTGVAFRVENAATGNALSPWRDVGGVGGGSFSGTVETVAVRVPDGVGALRVVVRVTNGAGRSAISTQQVLIRTLDRTPPEVLGIQAYVQGDRLLIFIDGMVDQESFIDRVEYRVIRPDGSILIDWSDYPVVPSRRASYGRQLVRAAIPAEPGVREVIVQLSVFNGAGLRTSVEERVQLGQ